jgi:hypothetical protein
MEAASRIEMLISATSALSFEDAVTLPGGEYRRLIEAAEEPEDS